MNKILLALLVMSSFLFAEVKKAYYPGGELKHERTYKNGIQEGKTKGYYTSGELESESLFKNGKPEGIGKEYYPNGKVKYEVLFKNS